MSRFNTPEEVKAWAMRAATGDYQKHEEHGMDLNPFCTPGARHDWQRGFDNDPPRPYETHNNDFNTIYQRGKAAAEIIKERLKHETPTTSPGC